ncbi:MAG: helix-turn-helix domain-containing protein, partial [Methylocella sp.]
MSAIEMTRQYLSIAQLRAEAARAADAKQTRRILAIAMVLDGHSRRVAAQPGGMDRQTRRDRAKPAKGSSWRSQLEWLAEGIRYTADGLAGLVDRPRPGRRPRLAEAQLREVAKWLEDGPDRKTDGVVRWRCAGLRDRIAAKFPVHLHERSVGKLLKKLNFSSM